MTEQAKHSLQLGAIRSKLSKLSEQWTYAHANKLQTSREFKEGLSLYEDLQEAKTLIQDAALECQASCQRKISQVVTRCLEAVFGAGLYSFELIFETKRNQTECRGVLVDAAGNQLDPLTATGGGVVEVAAFGLRLACLLIQRPQPAKVLVLDETFSRVSSEYRENLAQMLKELSEELRFQIILITHLPELVFENNVVIR